VEQEKRKSAKKKIASPEKKKEQEVGTHKRTNIDKQKAQTGRLLGRGGIESK